MANPAVGKHSLYADGALSGSLRAQPWPLGGERQDDDLATEIKAKFAAGYPEDNILFQEPRHAVLYQQGERSVEAISHAQMTSSTY